MEQRTTTDEVLKLDAPRDAKVIATVLKAMGVEEFQPRVVNQLMEFLYRYITEILQDAQMYSEHAGRSEVAMEDIQLAVQARVRNTFTQPPPREILLELAREKNNIALPSIPGIYSYKQKFGVLLPPDEWCLVANTYQVDPVKAGGTGPDAPSSGAHANSSQGSSSSH